MLKSLRARLILSYVAVVGLSLLLGFVTLVIVIRPILVRLTFATLTDKALPTVRLVSELARQGGALADIKTQLEEQASAQNVRILIAEPKGLVRLDAGGDMEGRTLPELASAAPDPTTRYIRGRLTIPGGSDLLYVGIPVQVSAATSVFQRPVILIVAAPARSAWTVLREMFSGFLWAGLVTLAVATLLALLLTRALSTPIRKIAEAAHAVAAGNYEQKLVIDFPSEMREVASAFNDMAVQVSQSRQTMRDFVANVSHELKTPLTSIRGFAEAVLDGAAGDEAGQRHAVETIRDESLRMIRMVEQLLDLSKIESGQVTMARNPVQIDQVLRVCVERLSIAAEQAGVRLTCECPPLPTITGDGDRLAQVFTNLLDNALKHTPAGGRITASARLVPALEASGAASEVEIAVTDTGQGIPAGELNRVFERFYQVDKSRARSRGGTGLGLAICKSIVDAHGGKIWAESVEGLGSRFVVRLPVGGNG